MVGNFLLRFMNREHLDVCTADFAKLEAAHPPGSRKQLPHELPYSGQSGIRRVRVKFPKFPLNSKQAQRVADDQTTGKFSPGDIPEALRRTIRSHNQLCAVGPREMPLSGVERGFD